MELSFGCTICILGPPKRQTLSPLSISLIPVKLSNYIIIYYVTEHQLPPVIDTSHTTPFTHVNQGPKLLKLIGWRHCLCFRWVPCILETTAQTPGSESGPTLRLSGTCITGMRRGRGVSHPTGTLQWNSLSVAQSKS